MDEHTHIQTIKKGRGHPDLQPAFTSTGQRQLLSLISCWTSILWSVVSCENRVFADQYCRLRCTTYWDPFLEIVSWPYWSWHQLHKSLACSILGVRFVSNCLETQKLVWSFEALSFWMFSSNPPPISQHLLRYGDLQRFEFHRQWSVYTYRKILTFVSWTIIIETLYCKQ